MKLTEQHMALLHPKIANAICQMCQGNRWTIFDQVVMVHSPIYVKGTVAMTNLPTDRIPAIQVTCNTCRQIVLFNAADLGIMT